MTTSYRVVFFTLYTKSVLGLVCLLNARVTSECRSLVFPVLWQWLAVRVFEYRRVDALHFHVAGHGQRVLLRPPVLHPIGCPRPHPYGESRYRYHHQKILLRVR